jgi:hypothetical protein
MAEDQGAARVDFPSMDWERVARGGLDGRTKRWMGGGKSVRLLELSSKSSEEEWCTRGHWGYVLKGTLLMDLDPSGRRLELGEGRGFAIPPGQRHKASCKKTTLIFIVDDVSIPAAT